ncbi:DUF2505 domain-containing protein [Corynebacterium lactis]|uniref:DUF2505 domain-containing protein n=1 Tax=Corynebacterium lactis RW2-5 TaxID=1408189 RepID=A0A0K2GYN9_9CORY|nr:DUF2505 domain-containing protein [Corynebacterium lactis]ALA66596.1 hypothetical protein CLAC_01340 [Corynebacterium lactis RW2-5]
MTTRNTHTVNFTQPVDKIYASLTDASFWEKVANRFSAAEGKVEKFETSEAGTTVVIRQSVAADKIPDQAQKFVKSGVSLTRTFVISPLADGTATSTVTTETSGVPVTFQATQKLAGQGEGSVLTTDSEFSITVPLVGGMLEGKAAPYLERVLDAETAVLAEHAA